MSGGRRLVTLRDAIRHISETVPKSEHDHPKIQHAATCLAGAAEERDFVMHARIAAVIQALKRNDPPLPLLDLGKQFHWGKRKPKRDQRPFLSTSTQASRSATLSTSRCSPM
ncbi:hypothetical protein GWE18_07710 [Bradyrhizobium sp. CSA112]|uniref:hypothetical protein n=1 Tax=Bradyrhizobium sp. CSA112 TaxID=2699170 RepID=UPI0023AFD88A|nr:hypothetical protein [Bradyrhizobium sp. CSA112]MDE5452755.1 hypothetical protein [Bradyrhizobium sp. CSA112]